MGQQASSLAPVHPVTGSAMPSGSSRPRVAAMPPQYTPLCDSIKAGDPTATVPAMTEEVKDALGKILEFGSALRYLPRDADTAGSRSVQNVEQQLQEILSAVDSPEELFQYISNLAALAPEHALDSRKDGDAHLGNFDMRVASYVKSLQQVYQLTKKERQHYEQRLQSARTQAASQRKVVPPPLPLPTQNCMTMGWDLVIHLLKATRADNPANYLQALQMIKSNLASLKPTAYADGMYLAPSASTSFNLLSECLSDLANLTTSMPSDVEAAVGASTIETLAEVALARGSLAMLLTVIFWLMKQAPSSTVNLGVTLAKLAMLKEQPLYGKCEASGELYCCGQNSYGELGIGDDIERHQLTSVSLCGWDDIRQVVSGNEMLAILTNGGVVLTCGLNKSGQCGHGHFDERVLLLRPVQALRSQKIKFIAASNGCEHMIAVTDTGLAYSWGYNDRGQLGHENLTTKIHVPKLIESMKDKKVSFAAVSYHHSAVVTESGELYTFGMNDCGQLGLDHTQHVATPQLVKSLDGYEVSMVSCGLYHTVVCTAGGEVFSCGKNDYGQLGLGHSRQVKVATQVLLPNEIVCFVACGYYHSIVLTTTGHTYSFGRNDYGQLGIGTKVHQNVPNVVALSANTRMIRATCGCYHTVMLSEHGQVYVFGRNNKGQLGNRSSADSLLPVPLKVRPEKNTRRCIDIAAGFYTTSLIYERKRENEDSDALVLDQSCLVALCGRVDIDRSGEVEGLSNFGSISTTGVALFDGKWFYEVEVVSSGLIQIGWIDNNFQGSSDQGEGVGDHSHSWSYDGNRQRRWNSGSTSYGEKWKAGDVIGCLLDLESREMTFYRNGINLGVAFTDLKCSVVDRQSGLMPGISLERGEIIRVNLGNRPFAYPPTNVGEFDAVLKAITYPATAVNIKCVEEHTNDAGPPPLEGSASVLIKNTIFVIGGSLSESAEGVSSEASNQVWVYHQDTGRWERWTDFPLGIRYHQAVALDSDHILVIGGENSSQSSRHMDLYKCSAVRGIDGSLPPWELVQGAIGAATSLPAPRAHHIAATIRVRLDTMVFLYGGKSAENETLGDIWYLSLDDFSWSRLPNSMSLDPGPRSGCDVTVIGECVYIFGGYDKEEKLHADLWRYNAFDRVWYLCHDENIAATPDSSVVSSENGVPASRSDFSPLAPEARANYCLCADYGNVWLCGGMGHAGRMLKDIWCYSITSQKWSNIDISSDDSISDGFCCGKLVVPYGVATALTQVPEQAPPSACPGRIMLFGGRVLKNGQSFVSSRVRAITPSDCARSFTSDVTKSIPTSGKSSVMLGTLRSKCTGSTIKANQQCQPEALDGSVCLLAHLDRLAGNDIPSDDTETIQSSRCPYRSLCVDPRDKTFAALHDLLHKLSVELVKLGVLNEQEDRSNEVVYVLYPLLVVVRLLKLNFFELSRCSLDPAEVGLLPESIKPGGVLHSIRELLFNIAEHNLTPQPSGEVAWYYRAVKQETAAAIYQGFSTLFPSLLDRMEVMNKLMKDDLSEGMSPSPTKKLLIPMLVPCFTAPRMLFQLMAEAPVIFTTREHVNDAGGIVTKFAHTLLDTLWKQTTLLVDTLSDTESSVVSRKFAELDQSAEFRCLNVLIRACIYWCSHTSQHGWPVMEAISVKLVEYFGQLLDATDNIHSNGQQQCPIFLQHTFPGKLLPFVLISVSSLPSVRDVFASTFRTFWPSLERLLHRIHTSMEKMKIESTLLPAPIVQSRNEHEKSLHAASDSRSALFPQQAVLSEELCGILRLPPTSSAFAVTDVLQSLWTRIVSSDSFRAIKIRSLGASSDLYRVFIPSDMAKLFCTASIVIGVGEDIIQGDIMAWRRIDQAALSFNPSRMVLSQHIWFQDEVSDAPHKATGARPAPVTPVIAARKGSFVRGTRGRAGFSMSQSDESLAWLVDLQKLLTWVGSHYAATLVIGCLPDQPLELDARWMSSPLLRGGLQGVVSKSEGLRNDSLLSQIVSNCGAGKKLVDKVKEALDPGSGSGSGPNTKKLLAARLKRQDSVEAALEKSGSIESVDKAVRVAFAVLLKHSHTAYVTDALTSDGTPPEPVVDAWRSAIQLRRWIVREQQKRASEMGTAELYGTDGNMRDRQQVLYNVVCEPIIRRGEFLLSIAAAPSISSSTSSSPFKLLPGISSATVYDPPQPVKTSPDATHGEENSTTQQAAHQLKLLMETKSMEIIEAEDERTQSDVFMFLQQSAKPKVEDTEVPDQTLEDSVKLVLQSHQIRGRDRLDGLMVFSRLLQYSESNPSCRLLIVPALSTAFKRVHRKPSDDPVIDASTTIGKVHYLENLEFAGVELVDSITSEFFSLLSALLSIAQGHLRGVKEAFDGGVAVPNGWLHDAVREVMLAFEACSVPYRDNDWERVDRIKLLALLTELTNWGSWKATLQMDGIDDTHTDPSRGDESPIIPAGLNQRCPKIICPRSISIGTDLHQLTLAHHLSSLPNGESCKGAIAVFDNQFYHGRWYWEVSIISQSEHPVFVGVVSSDDDLNRGEGERHNGVYVFKESFPGDVQALGGVRCRVGSSVGVLLNCEGKRLEIFSDGKRICVVSIDIKDSLQGLYAAIGIHDAEVHWNLTAPVPEKLWCNGFQFPSAVVSGCLVAAPFDGKCISWDAKSKGKQLRLTADGTTVIAGDSGVSDEQFETVLANQGFDSDVIFVEFEVLSVGRNGRCDLSFSIVGSDNRALDSRPSQTVDVRVNWPENTVDWGVFGVLFDFGKGKVTVFPHSSEPLTGTIDVSSSQLKRPLYPALSILCNGSIIRADFHPRARLELQSSVIQPSCVSENSNVTASQDTQTGKLMQMQVLTCDGGEFSPSHAARNCLVDDSSVFSSTKGSNVNLVLRHEVDSPFCLSYISIRGPGPGYSSPLRHAIVFVLSSAPDLKRLQAFNNMTPEEFACLPFPIPNPQSDRSELLPVAYFVLDGSCAQIAKQLATPIMGRYIVVKLICPAAGSNIDVGYLGFYGTFDRENGPAYAESSVLSATCEECKTSPLYGVYYCPKDDDMIKVCAACYDDYRGNLHESYFAHVDVDTDGRNDDGVALCLPRDVWQEKLSSQLGPLKRTKVLSGNTESMAASSANTRGASKIERSIAWYEDCELFSCGQNNYGELCLGHCNSTSKLEHVPFFSTKSVRDIAGGNEVLAVLMKDGTLYTCGLNKSGQCGNGTFEERVLVATPVRALSGVPIHMIAAANGCEHMLAVGADGSVYSWGYNDRGQLGLGSTISKSHTPRLVESLREKYVITCAAVSYHHSAVISSVGELLTFGMNDCGQLGLDHTQHQHTPQLVDSLSSQVITKVACGLYHTIAVTATGELYAFGKNDYGQLGLGHARNVKIPTLVRVMIGDSDEKIIDVSCGYYHTVAITEKGKLMTWGRNDYGQLGIGSKDHKNAPQYVPLPLSSRIRKTSCGCYHTLILLANGRVMVFGRNNKGQLGAGARTLPSADLPLPIPSNSLANDEVMCIAAGFYSSYILTGRSSQSCEPTEGNDTVTHAKDLPEHTNSEALYESLMKEIDRKQETDLAVKSGPIQIKKSQLYRKIPMLKLHTASWAMVRALLYQMLKTPVGDAHLEFTKKKRKGVLNILTGFLLDNLKQLQAELNLDVEDLLQEVGVRLDSCMSLKNACVGMLMFCASKNQLPATYEPRIQTLYPHFFRNQLLWVLLSCGSTDAEVCSVIAGNKEVLGEILRGIASSDLASATICIRLAMLVFPQHSVAAVNTAYRENLGPGSASSDIINALMLLVGSPSVSRPRLCNHELGVERSCSALCQSTKCLKRLVPVNDSSMVRAQEQVLEQSHIAIARAAEVLSLLRYLTLFPTWKIAVNASLTRAFARTDKLNEQLDAICQYYSSIQHSDDDSAAIVPTEESDQHQLNDITPSTLRKPESTSASPEIDESSSTDANGSDDKSADAKAATEIRDKKALKTWQRAKDALDSLTTLLAAVSVVGGHIETLREGVSVVVDDKEHKNSGQSGILLNLKKDTRGELSANILLGSRDQQATWAAQSLSGTSNIITGVPVKSLCPIESIPSVLNMFDGVDGIVNTLSLLVLPAQDDGTLLAELEQPQNNSVQVIVGPYLQSFKKQLQWRSMKALGGLLKQMPRLVTDLIHGDTNLLSNIAQTIATENPVKNEATLGLMRIDDRLGGVHICDLLHHRWQSVKQRQVVLDTERVVDSCLDLFESDTREQVVNKLGQENALSWGLDAIQSPRKNMTTSPFLNGKTGPSAESRSGRGQNETSRGRSGQNEMPNGTWGVLHPLPQLNEAENGASTQPQAVDAVPFHLATPIVRVGRAADSCDLIINDRSVSGRHFHLRRVRRDSEVSEDFYELQDFSKNGTIVNGVRVHGTSVRITPGSRISLILSRGGLVTYEFQVRTTVVTAHSHGLGAHASGMTRTPPPPIITSSPPHADGTVSISGQEYQQPGSTTHGAEPRSPAEIQNRGARQSTNEIRRVPAAAQGLRLITSITESDVPRALISPNPAVESPRVGGFTSPRSSILQAPGTPTVPSPTASMYSNMIPPSILSPASFQQRESSASSEAHTMRAPEAAVAGDALRIALGRESVNRESTHRNSLTFGAEPPRLKSFTDLRDSTPMDSQQALLNDLAARLRAEGFDAALEQCHEALSLMDGDSQAAYTTLREQISTDMAYTREDAQSPTVQHLAELLGKYPAVCAEALRQTQNNTTSAMRLLLSPAGAEMERTLRRSLSTATRQRADRQDDRNSVASTSSDGIINVQEMMDENASYLLMESSSHQQPQRLRPGSPTKARLLDTNSASKSQLSLWIECIQGVDERVTTMSAIEIDQEETALCEVLTAVHARQLMRQIVRLFTDAEDQADNVLAAFSDPVTLRHLILFPQTSNSADDKNQKEVEEQVDSSVQRILSRMSEECFKAAGGSTVSTNLRLVENLSRLALSIDADKTWLGVSTGLPRLIHKLLDYEAHALTEDQSGLLRQTNMIHNLMVDTLLHTLSRTYVHHGSLMNWEAVMSKTRRPELVCPKGPIRLSSGIECIVVSTYDRMWSVPSPDPLLQYRHKWRKRSRTNGRSQESWLKANGDNYTTIWRPALPGGVKIASKTWFSLGDVLHVGGEIPETPVLLVSDDDGGLLLPPVGFERVDVSGKGLPKNSDNDPDFQRKQVRSLWWPIPPPGYAALGCFAGSKEDPFEPPSISSVRCIREDLVQRVESYTCMWRAEAKSFGPPTLLRALDHAADRKNQQADGHSLNLSLGSEELCVQISLWSVNSEFCGGILPVISVSGTNASGHSSSLVETATAFTINLSLEDKIVLAPITVNNVMSFVNTLIGCQQRVSRQDKSAERPVWTTVRPELSAALFALLKQILKEKLPGGGHTAVRLVRAMITLIESGCPWRDKKGVLYCRSKIMTLQQDQEGGLMLNALLQALVELMLAVDEQNRVGRIEELTSCLDKDAKSSTMHLPYRFHFARDSHKEMLVSHSSKMAVTRHFSGEERRFLLEYHGDDTNPTALAATENSPPQNDHVSCRFEHTPELIMTLKNELKAEIVYFEVTIMEWGGTASTSSPGNGVLSFGYSPPEFPLEGLGVGLNPGDVKTYSFTPLTGKVQSPDLSADHWQWNEQVTTVAIGDIYGCGLRVDTHEVFLTKNGQLLGIAFSSVDAPWNLHPTISVNAECKLMINFGSSGAVGDRLYANKVNFAFRFNALDYDNVMSGFEWYEQLSQVYGVMKALLVHRQDKTEKSEDSGVLPDEFMLSADNFLSEISKDVCIRVESGHPYDLELQEALVSIPLATSIRVKLDSQCETANSHCLQILQGGDNGESTSESEVRAFTGACGGQEVMIDGDSFVWRFPVQSNFQCRVDRVRKGPYLKLENRDTRLSLTRDKGWQTAIGVARFDSGIHIWEVRITFVTASSNIFLGIARRDVRLDSYLGKDNRGWGWIGNRALWHNGSKQRGTYGEKFKTGDVVRMTLDLKRGTLSYALNGKDLGVAFGPGGVGPKLEGTFYPGFALYNQRDSIDLIGGHRVEDGEVLPLGVNLALGGDEAYYSEDEDDAMGESDDSIPNFRMELATALTQMGFPMDWCVYALKHCDDDAEQAADFILANMHVMEALVREEAEAQSRRARHREAMAAAAAAAVEGPTIVSASESTPGDQELDQPTPAVSSEMAVDAAVPQNADKWGIAFTAVPEFSVTGRRLLAVKYGSKLRQLHASQAIFTPELDNAIVQIVNEICEARAEALLSCDPLRMAPEDFVPTEEHLRRFPQLQSVPLPQLQKRFLILRNFNCRLQNSLSFIDFSVEDEQSLLARGSRALRGIIFQNVKLAWWLNILKEQQSPAAARPEIEVDRHRAREATEVSGMKDSVFAQCFDQLHSIQPSLLRGADRAFKCQFVGEFGDDFGGLYRECLAQISSELQSKVLPVLKPCPNAISLTGENREQYVPSAHLRSDARLVQMAEFLGKLIGIAIRTKTPLDLNLPAVFWKMLVHQRVTRQDIEAIHKGCFQVVDTIDNINKHGITESMFDEIIDTTFTVLSSSRQEVELVPGGRAVPVQWEDKDAYARAVETYRLTEFAPVCEDIVRGIATILPAPTVSLFTWKEFATLVCGKPTVDVDLLRRRTIYGDGCQATDAHIAYFWEVLQEFTDEQKSSFLRFVWGRSRLPTHAADFTQDFKISGLPKAAGRADQYLPIAHTCFFSIDLPSYSTRDVMRDKLLYAITHCQSIDADNTTVAQRAGQGLNWTAATNATTAVSSTSTVSATLAATTTAAATAAAAVSSVIAGLSASITES